MQGGAGNRSDGEKAEEPPGSEAARHRAAERQEPHRIDADMDEIGMQKRIGEPWATKSLCSTVSTELQPSIDGTYQA
jgi:hypothetical protein